MTEPALDSVVMILPVAITVPSDLLSCEVVPFGCHFSYLLTHAVVVVL